MKALKFLWELVLSILALAAMGVLLLALVAPAFAATGTATITFTRPTKWSDGSTLAASEITGYQVECTFTPTGGTATSCTAANLPGGNSSSGQVTITYPAVGGIGCFRLKTLTAQTSSDTFSQPPACKAFPPITPNNPTDVTVTVVVSVIVSGAPN